MEAVHRLGQALQSLGVDQQVLTVDDPSADYLQDFPLPVEALGPASNFYGHSRAYQPWLQAHASEFDAVIAHGLWQYPTLSVWQTCAGRVPYYVFPHGMLDPWFNRRYPLKFLKKLPYWWMIERPALNAAKGILYTAEAERDLARRAFPRYRPREIVCGLGTSAPAGQPPAQVEAFEAAFPALKGRRFLLFLGRLCEKKGVDLLVQAYAQKDALPFDLVLAGPGGDTLFVQALQARYAHPRLHWPGPVTGDVKWGALRAAEALVLPSHQENFGLVVAEALAVGTPALLTRQVNIWREVTVAQAGLTEADTLAGITALLDTWAALEPNQRDTMRAAAQPCFEQHFRIETTAERLRLQLQRDLTD
ncbi:MAG: glycosyl transferase group 1 [Puniceicoccaceae bacterium 5H]|nr:MAG: glycosyl transferase group 1 [Puniceicoccaceae bacterium 5H]